MSSGSNISVSLSTYSGDLLIIFTFLWAFIVAILLTTKDYRDIDFAFVTNRMSSNISNIGFLLTASIIGAITAILAGVMLRVIVFFILGSQGILMENFFISAGEIFTGFSVTTLYLFLIVATGYLCGVLVQINKIFLVILPAFLFGTLALMGRGVEMEIIMRAVNFILLESSLPGLAIKIILLAGVLFSASSLLSNNLEVRK